MKESESTSVFFSEEDVEEWCMDSEDYNPLHLDEVAAEKGPFGERVVPGMMLLDRVSGQLSKLAGDDETLILTGITAARFRDPVLFDEWVTISVEVEERSTNYTSVYFEVHADDRDSLCANGVVNVTIE